LQLKFKVDVKEYGRLFGDRILSLLFYL
jgi:hypothetical protein